MKPAASGLDFVGSPAVYDLVVSGAQRFFMSARAAGRPALAVVDSGGYGETPIVMRLLAFAWASHMHAEQAEEKPTLI
jgi:hypothetical protein